METSLPPIKIELNFMERDTLLACLKDTMKMKETAAQAAYTEQEISLLKQQLKIVKELHDRIYEQKMTEWEKMTETERQPDGTESNDTDDIEKMMEVCDARKHDCENCPFEDKCEEWAAHCEWNIVDRYNAAVMERQTLGT